MTRTALLILFFGFSNLVNGQTQTPKELCVTNDILYFVIQRPDDSDQLWKTDGDCFFLIKDCGANETCQYSKLINFNNTLFFLADHGTELWKSDGTTEGTKFIKNIGYGTALFLTVVNETLFFVGDDYIKGKQLWKSDGTSEGTKMVKELVFNSTISDPIRRLTPFKGLLFFYLFDSNTSKHELWKTDGSAEGTIRVKSFDGGVQFLTTAGEYLFFTASTAESGFELWRSDGTTAGTTLVKDIYPGADGSGPQELIKVGANIYFAATHPTFGRELWKSDGSAAGTTLVSDIVPGAGNGSPTNLKNLDGVVYFVSWDGGALAPLWKTDGTESGTLKVYDFMRDNSATIPFQFTEASSQLFFVANDGTSGNELWKTDGTQEGTQLVIDISPGNGDVYNLRSFQNYLYYTAVNDVNYSLWRTNGTLEYTEPLTVQQQSNCQFISFPFLVDRTLGGQPFSLIANASSELPIRYSSTSNKIELQGSLVTMLESGRVTITAEQEGDNDFSPAIPVSRSFCINPSAPIISKIESAEIVLKSNYDLGNQWYLNKVPIEGETNSTLTIQLDGEYSVKVAIDECVSQFSNTINIITTAMDEGLINSEGLLAFPNPVGNSLFIEGNIKIIKVYNIQGLEISVPYHYSNKVTELNCEILSSGMYYVQFKSEGVLRSSRFIKK